MTELRKKFLKDKDGNRILPITHMEAVKDSQGNSLTSVLGDFEDEVRGLVDTPHQEYVTVDAYASLPASGSKDTIYRVSNYNGSTSQVDASVYSEYAWNGTQYIFLCVKSQIGEVFDISVYNNNTKYADLTAALNGGANIPQSLQKGGMTVKYVRTPDNKYIQARCMADEFTTDVTKWQEVDDVPTAGSDNLVKSGGVYENLLLEKQRVCSFKEMDLFPGYLDGSLQIVNWQQSKYVVIKVKSGDTITKTNSGNFAVLKSFDINPTLPYTLDFATGETGYRNEVEDYVVPEDGKYVLLSVIKPDGGTSWLNFSFILNGVDLRYNVDKRREVVDDAIIATMNTALEKDNVPTIASEKLVKSKGVYGELQKRNGGDIIYGLENVELIDGYIDATGILPWDVSKYAAIKVTPGSTIYLRGNSNTANYVFVKSCDFSIVNQSYDFATGWDSIKILRTTEVTEIVPTDAKYLLIVIIKNGVTIYPQYISIDDYVYTKPLFENLVINSTKNDFRPFIESLAQCSSIFGYLDGSNQILEYEQARHIVLPVIAGDNLFIKSKVNQVATAIAFVKSYRFGTTLPYPLDLATNSVTTSISFDGDYFIVPSDAKYIIITYSHNNGTSRLPEKFVINSKYDLANSLWDNVDNKHPEIVDYTYKGVVKGVTSKIRYLNQVVTVNNVKVTCFKDGIFSFKGTGNNSGGRMTKLSELFPLSVGSYIMKVSSIPTGLNFYISNEEDSVVGTYTSANNAVLNITTAGNYYFSCNVLNETTYDIGGIKAELLQIVDRNVDETAYDAYARNYTENLKGQLENEIGLIYSNPIGSWWNNTLPNKIATINAHGRVIGYNGIGFIFITDYHYGTSNNKSHAIMKYIQNNTSVNEVVYGGDTTDSWGFTPEQTAEKFRQIYNEVFKTLDIIPVRGNHDINPFANDDRDYIPDSAYYDIMLRHLEENSRVKMDGHAYYYVDNDVQKIRYIILDWGSNVHNPWDDGGLQAAFLKAKLTELSSDWGVIIFSHGALAKNSVNDEPHVDARSQYMFDAIDEVYDSLNCTLIAVIAGHQHRDMSKVMSKGYNVIVTTCDSSGANAAYDWNDPIRENGTTNECAFDVVQVDKTNRKIYYTRIGSGTDREFSY